MSDSVTVTWRPRQQPLEPRAVLAHGGVARALVRRLLEGTDESLAVLHGVGGARDVVLLGEPTALPWVDGALFLGVDARAPSLLLPTTLEPDVHPALLERALKARPGTAGPLALHPEPGSVVPVQGARPLNRARLEAWLSASPC